MIFENAVTLQPKKPFFCRFLTKNIYLAVKITNNHTKLLTQLESFNLFSPDFNYEARTLYNAVATKSSYTLGQPHISNSAVKFASMHCKVPCCTAVLASPQPLRDTSRKP